MVIAGKSIGYRMIAHNGKRNAIGETPGFVGSAGTGFETATPKLLIERNQGGQSVGLDDLKESERSTSPRRTGEPVGKLLNDPGGGYDRLENILPRRIADSCRESRGLMIAK